MNHYAYRIYKTLNNPIVGGTVSAANMEQAAQQVIKQNGVQVIHETRNGYQYHDFMLNGSKVGILLYVNPEDY
jgi:hypothetical protein